ncbi:MAG: sigma-B regulation protein RsbU (phosphoserine phosphatase) [Planctomycetota bacterium]|jgi:sigma-B regulation protein RsbU (phosphoserine phosphatase)
MVFWKKKAKAPELAGGKQKLAPTPSNDQDATQFLTGDAMEDQRRTDSLLEEYASIAERVVRLSGHEDLDDLLTYIVDASIRRTESDRGMLILDSGGGNCEVRIARQRGSEPLTGDLRYSTSVVKKVLETRLPLKDISSAEAGDLGASIFDLKLRSLMCVPFDTGADANSFRGVLYVDSKAATREFGASELAYFARLSTQIVSALKTMVAHLDALERARLEASLENASIVQDNLMPQVPSDFSGYDVFGWYRAAERTSGDFYDFFKTRDGRYGVVVGDVTGHGPASALITSQAQASLRSTVRVVSDLREAVGIVNEDIADRIEVGNFVTLFVALLSENGDIEVVNAGHTPPSVYSAKTGKITKLDAHGPALGMMDDFVFDESTKFRMETGDVLLVFTDGITEARKLSAPDDLLGEEGLEGLLMEGVKKTSDAKPLAELLIKQVLDFCADNCEDDMTMVAVRRVD